MSSSGESVSNKVSNNVSNSVTNAVSNTVRNSVSNDVSNRVSNTVINAFNKPVTICSEGYYLKCDRVGCNCRRNILDWFNNLPVGVKIVLVIVFGIIGLLLLLGLIYGGHYAINMYRRNNTYTTSSSALFLKSW